MSNNKMKDLYSYLQENKPKFYAIENTQLEKSTDYIKNGYLKLLAILLQQSEEIDQAQMMFFQRIVAGANTEIGVQEYLRMALEIEIEDFLNFTSEMKDNTLKFRLVLDAIIIACIQEKDREQIKLIAEYCERLLIDKEQLEYLVLLAKSVLELSISSYLDAYEKKVPSMPDMFFREYLNLMQKGEIYENDKWTVFHPQSESDACVEMLNQLMMNSKENVKIINANINLSNFNLAFQEKENVELISCSIKGGDKEPLHFKNCKNVLLKDVHFSDFKTRTIVVEEIETLKITDSSFHNCILHYESNSGNWAALGGVVFSGNPKKIGNFSIESCNFTECGGKNKSYYYKSQFISNIDAKVNNCKFENCFHINSSGKDPEDSRRTMFSPSSVATNIVIENSSKFN